MSLEDLVIDIDRYCGKCDEPIYKGMPRVTAGVEDVAYHLTCYKRKDKKIDGMWGGKAYEKEYPSFKIKRCKICKNPFKPTSGVQKYCNSPCNSNSRQIEASEIETITIEGKDYRSDTVKLALKEYINER